MSDLQGVDDRLVQPRREVDEGPPGLIVALRTEQGGRVAGDLGLDRFQVESVGVQSVFVFRQPSLDLVELLDGFVAAGEIGADVSEIRRSFAREDKSKGGDGVVEGGGPPGGSGVGVAVSLIEAL